MVESGPVPVDGRVMFQLSVVVCRSETHHFEVSVQSTAAEVIGLLCMLSVTSLVDPMQDCDLRKLGRVTALSTIYSPDLSTCMKPCSYK